jgi:hypothetical protein
LLFLPSRFLAPQLNEREEKEGRVKPLIWPQKPLSLLYHGAVRATVQEVRMPDFDGYGSGFLD